MPHTVTPPMSATDVYLAYTNTQTLAVTGLKHYVQACGKKKN